MADPKEWLSRAEAAAFLTKLGCPIAPGTLAKLAANNNAGNGPTYKRFRWKSVRYNVADLREWAADQGDEVAYEARP